MSHTDRNQFIILGWVLLIYANVSKGDSSLFAAILSLVIFSSVFAAHVFEFINWIVTKLSK